jgi:ABC-type transport system involved in multi-copper enzyme maturation permease subunit
MRFWGMFRFTVAESIRKGTLIFYCGIATIIIAVFAFGLSLDPADKNIIMLFGKSLAPKNQPDFNVVDFLLIQMHSSSSFWIVLFGVFGVAGLVPDMLEKGTIDLFLSKPLSRIELLMARALGGWTGISINLVYFITGIWLVFGLKLGVWHWAFLFSVVHLLYAFAALFSIVTICGLITRSSGLTIMLTFVFTIVSWGLELREKGLYRLWDNVIYHRVMDGLYYLLPQFSGMLDNSTRVIGKNPFVPLTPEFTYIPFLYSFLSTVLIYGLAVLYFERQDY